VEVDGIELFLGEPSRVAGKTLDFTDGKFVLLDFKESESATDPAVDSPPGA